MSPSPYSSIPFHEQTLEQLEAERAYFQSIADVATGLHSSRALLATTEAWIAERSRKRAA